MPSTLDGLNRAAVENISAERQEPQWLREKRAAAWQSFETLPTPDWTRGIRGWWNGSLKNFTVENFLPYAPAGSNLPDLDLNNSEDGSTAGSLVQYNSQVVQVELSEEARNQGVIFCSLEEAVRTHPEIVQNYFMTRCVPADENRFTAVHAALWTGGAFLFVPKNVVIDAPFRVVFYTDQTGLALFSHTLIVTETGARVRLVEEHRSDGQATDEKSFDSNVTEIFVGENARVEYYNPQEYGENITHFSVKRSLIGTYGQQNWMVATLGSDITRLTLESILAGQNSHTEMTGLSFSVNQQNFDIAAKSLHEVPHTSANALFKAVLDDDSQLGFRGAIRAIKGAQMTDSFLEDHTLYLSENSKADVLPSLDVDANDVRCSHGATIGMIDQDQIFYLMTRGLSQPQAQEMIVSGFFEGVIARVPLESVKQRLRQSIEAKLHL